MTKKVAVILSGCGVFDGSEIYEGVLSLLRLDQLGAEVTCFAPDIDQMHVINHATGEEAKGETRNVLIESARLARGKITSLSEAKAENFDALVVPGGFGAAKNLSDFAVKGAQLTVNDEFLTFAQAMHQAGKPVGMMCIAPTMAASVFGKGVECTIGTDPDTAGAIEAMGGVHKSCDVADVFVDEKRKLVTTPAYMLAGRISETAAGINKLIEKVMEMA